MPPLWLDYRLPPPGHQRPGWLLLIASLLVAAALIAYDSQLGNELTRREERVTHLRRQVQRLQGEAEQPVQIPTDVGEHSPARWEALFDGLEKAQAGNDTVTLLSLDPGPKEIAITGEAKDLPSVVDYVQRLQSARAFSHARLAEYDVVKEHPRRPVHFAVLADWQEGTR